MFNIPWNNIKSIIIKQEKYDTSRVLGSVSRRCCPPKKISDCNKGINRRSNQEAAMNSEGAEESHIPTE